jgi:transposase
MRPRGDPEILEERRRRAIELLKRGESPTDVAYDLRVSTRSIRRWAASYKTYGSDGIAARPTPPRKGKLTVQQEQDLVAALRQGPQANEFTERKWTPELVVELVRRRFGVRFHPHSIPRIIGRWNVSLRDLNTYKPWRKRTF